MTTVVLPFEAREMTAEEVGSVEEILGYKFKSRSLASRALTHASYYYKCWLYKFNNASASDYKQGFSEFPNLDCLEFLGDSVLNLLISWELFSTYPSLDSGKLTQLRAANVDTEKLARAAINNGLHRHFRHGVFNLEDKIQKFMESAKEYPLHSNGILDPPKVIADFVESVIGAVFLDSNYSLKTVWKVFLRLGEPLITVETLRKHPVAELYEFCQKRKLKPKFLKDKWKRNGTVKVLIGDKLVGEGVYASNKEIATNRAAKDALDKLKLEGPAKHDLTHAPEESGEVDQNCVSKNDSDNPKEATERDLNPPAKVKFDNSDDESGMSEVEAAKHELDYPAKQVSTEFDMIQPTQNKLDNWMEETIKVESTNLILKKPSNELFDKPNDVSMEEESTELNRNQPANESLDKAKDITIEEGLTEIDRNRPANEKLDLLKQKTFNLKEEATKFDRDLEAEVEHTELALSFPFKEDEKSCKVDLNLSSKDKLDELDLNLSSKDKLDELDLNLSSKDKLDLNLSSKDELDKLKKESTEFELISNAKVASYSLSNDALHTLKEKLA